MGTPRNMVTRPAFSSFRIWWVTIRLPKTTCAPTESASRRTAVRV